MVLFKIDLKTALVMAFIMIVCWNVALMLSPPTQNDWDLVDGAIKLQNDTNLPLYNDWSYGHWLRIRGFETNFKSGGENPDYNSIEKSFLALTNQDLSYLGCEKVMGFSSNVRSLNLWRCSQK